MIDRVILDLDGCISPEESIPWDLDAFAEFARLSREASAGGGPLPPFTLCTGRPQPYVEVLMKILDIRAPAICENGAVFYTLHDNYAQYGPGVTEEKILGMRAVRGFIDSVILPEFSDAVMQFGKEAQISVFSERPDIFTDIQLLIEEFVADRGGPDLLINASHYYLNISIDGVNKGNALRELLRQLGIGPDRVAGIGDTEGDLPLRDNVGFFACPANAKPAIKAVADYVSPFETIRGVLDILRRPELARRQDEHGRNADLRGRNT